MTKPAHFPGQEIVQEIADALLAGRKTVGVCESLTAGRIASTLCCLEGASTWFQGGLIVYNERLKIELALVDPAVIAAHGVVSEEVAVAMAQGARIVLGTDYAVAVTGNAGPTAGDDRAPVGTVCMAVSGLGQERVWTRHLQGSRNEVRALTERLALHLLRGVLEDDGLPDPDLTP